jgi:FkbM family methyltransferase
MNLYESLSRAEKVNEVFLNRKRESALINRFHKLLLRPFKYTYQQIYTTFKWRFAVSAEAFWGCELSLPLWDENARIIYFSGALGFNESAVTRFLMSTVHKGDVFYDVGANVGYYTSLGEALGASVHAFEPSVSTVQYVKANGPHSVINEVAVSDQNGTTSFYDIALSNKSGMSSMFQESIPELNQRTQVKRTVSTITLDSYIQSHEAPTVMKIDVEDAEGLVLAGANNLLAKHLPIIVMEVDNRPESAAKSAAALQVLFVAGYQPYEILQDGSTQSVSKDSLMSRNMCFKKHD